MGCAVIYLYNGILISVKQPCGEKILASKMTWLAPKTDLEDCSISCQRFKLNAAIGRFQRFARLIRPLPLVVAESVLERFERNVLRYGGFAAYSGQPAIPSSGLLRPCSEGSA
jgi:hypothetical protein